MSVDTMSADTMDESIELSPPNEAMNIDNTDTNPNLDDNDNNNDNDNDNENDNDNDNINDTDTLMDHSNLKSTESNGSTEHELEQSTSNESNTNTMNDEHDIDIDRDSNDTNTDTAIINGSHDKANDNNNQNKVNKIGYDSDGNLMPGFEDVYDDELAFSSESDFAIFMKQISSEIPLQRLVAVKRMIASCKSWGPTAVLSVLPRIKQLSCDKEMVIRQAIAEVLGPFAGYIIEYSGPSIVISDILPLIGEMLRDAMEVRVGAGSSLILISELLSRELVYEHILKIVLHMAHDDSDDSKITAIPLLGDLAAIVGSSVCKNYLCADLHALSQDNSFRVRKACVQYFGPICSQLSSSECVSVLLPIFISLCSDSIWSVRKGCVESFVDVSQSICSSERVQLIPIMEKFLNDSSRWVRNTAYEILGPFISTLNSKQISASLLTYFTSIPHLSSAEADADCTNHCAFNFPAVVLTVGRDRWDELNDTYSILCRKTFKSRKTLACSIHEIASVLGEELTEKYLLNSIEFFLKDIDDIRCGIIDNLWKILAVFGDKLRVEYISVLWELASESDVNWRFRLLLAQQLDEILYLYPALIIQQQIIPLIFQLCCDRMADVRYEAVYPIADAINILQNDTQCITQRINSIYKGRTYSKRLLYIRIAQSCFNRIDQHLFDEIFLNDLLNYAKDPIFNVRYCLARFIHENKLKNDNKYGEAINILKNDNDDVEIKRFFCNENEIEIWLNEKKILQKEMAHTNTIIQEQIPININNNNNEADSTDSSLYSSDSDDVDDNDDDSLNEDDLDDDDIDDDSLSLEDDQLKAVQHQLLQIDDNLTSIHNQSYNQEKEIQQIEEQMAQGLVHQDTPFKLNISKELMDEEDNDKTNTNNNYGLKQD